MDSQQEKVGYILGRQVAGDIKNQGLELSQEAFVKGFNQYSAGKILCYQMMISRLLC